jgi:membrane protein CcdC involved in cytochrome C biogenesis
VLVIGIEMKKSTVKFILAPFKITLSGFVLSKLWLWFVVPFFGVRSMSILEALGIMLVASLFNSSNSIHILTIKGALVDEDDDKAFALDTFGYVFVQLFYLALGYVFRFWLM